VQVFGCGTEQKRQDFSWSSLLDVDPDVAPPGGAAKVFPIVISTSELEQDALGVALP